MDWAIVEHIVLGVISLILSTITARYSYLRFIKPKEMENRLEDRRATHQEEMEDRESERVDFRATIREYKALLAQERQHRADGEKRCDERIGRLETVVDQLRNELISLHLRLASLNLDIPPLTEEPRGE